MPFTLNGVGTRYYGEDDRRPDGSYICTEWFVVLYVPVIPLRSWRLCRDQRRDTNAVVVRSSAYLLVEKLPISWPQVGRTYAFLAGCIAWWTLMIWLAFFAAPTWASTHAVIAVLLFVAFAAAPFFWLRWRQDETYKAKYGSKP